MSSQVIDSVSIIRRVSKQGRMYYISIPPVIGRHLHRKKVLIKIVVLPEEVQEEKIRLGPRR